MITKTECLNLLFDLKSKGIDCDNQIKQLIPLAEPTIEIIEYINTNQELNLRKFYEKLRKAHNDKKSKLYKNIVSINDKLNDPKDLLCTLASLQLQILLFNKSIEDNDFLSNARFDEISKVLLNYYRTKDIIPCQKLLALVRTDLKLLEEISK